MTWMGLSWGRRLGNWRGLEPNWAWEADDEAQAPEQCWDQAPWGWRGHLFPGWGPVDRGYEEGSLEEPGKKRVGLGAQICVIKRKGG